MKDFVVQVYPNPVNDVLNIKADKAANESKRIEIHDVNGRMVISESFDTDQRQIDLSLLKSGVYFYSVHTNSQSHRGENYQAIILAFLLKQNS